MARNRRKGDGSIIKRNGRYYLRGVNPATGRYTMRGLAASSMEEARDAAKPIIAEWSRLARLEEREEAILQLARTRKLIAEETHGLDDIWRLYLDAPTRPQKTSPKRLEDQERALGLFLAYCRAHGVRTPSGITAELAQGWLNGIERDLSTRSYNAYRGMVRPVFAHAWRALGMDADPMVDIAQRRAVTQSRRDFTAQQVEAVLRYLDAPTGYSPEHLEQYRIVILLGMFAGARLGDACLMAWDYIDLDAREITYQPHKTAETSGIIVTLPIHPTLLNALVAAKKTARNGFVCPDAAERYRYNKQGVSKTIQRIIHDATGLEVTADKAEGRARAAAMYGMHSFKHTFVSFCTEAGVSPWVVSYLAGHTSPSMSEHYYHASDEAKRRAVLSISTGAKKAGARERLLELVERATDAECEKMLAALEEAGKRDGSGDQPSQD